MLTVTDSFMSDRFPGNEKILLENGAMPSV